MVTHTHTPKLYLGMLGTEKELLLGTETPGNIFIAA